MARWLKEFDREEEVVGNFKGEWREGGWREGGDDEREGDSGTELRPSMEGINISHNVRFITNFQITRFSVHPERKLFYYINWMLDS